MMRKKGDLASPIIMWIAVLSITIIVISWYVTVIRPMHGESGLIDHDLRQLFIYVDNACNSRSYEAKYNPRLNHGVVSFNESRVCLSTQSLSSCMGLTCPVDEFFSANLTEIVYLVISKQEDSLVISSEEFS